MLVKEAVRVSAGYGGATKHAQAHMLPAQHPRGSVSVSKPSLLPAATAHQFIYSIISNAVSQGITGESSTPPGASTQLLVNLKTLEERHMAQIGWSETSAQRIPKDNTHLAAIPPDCGAASFPRLWDILTHQRCIVISKNPLCGTRRLLFYSPGWTFNTYI